MFNYWIVKNSLLDSQYPFTRLFHFLLHLLFWTSGIVLTYLFFGVKAELICMVEGEEQMTIYREKESLYFLLVGSAIKASFFYWNAIRLLPSFSANRKYRHYIGWALLIVLIGIVIEMLVARFVIYPKAPLRILTGSPFIGFNFLSWLFYWGISVSYGLIKMWQKNEQQRQALMEEKLKTELNFLKFQINPHFLFNTLNNLFSIAQKYKVAELEKGISGLASMMRYMVYESNVELVRLDTEVKYLQSFIEMQQLQFEKTDDIIINFKINGEGAEEKYISPMLLIPFVENATKHGIDISQNSIIQINLTFSDDKLRFQVSNTCHKTSSNLEHQTRGIGLENVKRRLELLYQDEYELTIKEDPDLFECILSLPLVDSSNLQNETINQS